MVLSYFDSEVQKFHPLCEKALNEALKRNGMNNKYQVVHHQTTGTLEMDFVIQNKKTGKYFCVVEVKRTPSDVHSARYQYQAMSYIHQNAEQSEKPYYILTNLECAIAFKYRHDLSRVLQQMLKPGFERVSSFEKDFDIFFEDLVEYFTDKFSDFVRDSVDYLLTYDNFANHMNEIMSNHKSWKTHLAVLLYEYIRGAFSFVSRNELHNIRLFNDNLQRICEEASKVNFKEIFTYSEEDFNPSSGLDTSFTDELFNCGKQDVSGDSIADVLHSIVSYGHEHEGEVPTDSELGILVGLLAKSVSGDLLDSDYICDPASGSGNLLSAAINVYGASPKQILANDKNKYLLELLSLRFGLTFPRIISKACSPTVTTKPIEILPREYFNHVKVVVLNPPFLSAIEATEKIGPIYRKIESLSGMPSITREGNPSLEMAFLELVTQLVADGTTIAVIFPKIPLVARGLESQSFRNFLLKKFGLQTIFSYPGNKIFESVTKDTCILVGKKGASNESIKILSSYVEIPDIDATQFGSILTSELTNTFTTLTSGLEGRIISKTEMMNEVVNGWRFVNSEMTESMDFVTKNFAQNAKMTLFETLECEKKRGTVGNSGGSDLLFVDSREDIFAHFRNDTSLVLENGLRNAKIDHLYLDEGDSKFLSYSVNTEDKVYEVVDYYLTVGAREGKQPRYAKSREQWKDIIKKDGRNPFPSNSVFVPRDLRRMGRVFLSRTKIHCSTNFFVCSFESQRNAVLLASWVSTIFFQLICEVNSKDQEGTRKMEINDINKTFIPIFDDVSEKDYSLIGTELETLKFIDLQTPNIREIDRIWGRILFGDRADDLLNSACSLLSFLATRRNTQ